MKKKFLIIYFCMFGSFEVMSQTPLFSKSMDSLFFGVALHNFLPSGVDSLKTIPGLKYDTAAFAQSALNLENKTSRLEDFHFGFAKSPLKGLHIDTGYILLRVQQKDNNAKISYLNWMLVFSKKTDADKYIARLKKIFGSLSPEKHYEANGFSSETISFRVPPDEAQFKDETLYFQKDVGGRQTSILLTVIAMLKY